MQLLPYQGDASYHPHFFSNHESNELLQLLIQEIQWKQEPITIFGKQIMQPRLTAWYGDETKPYSYSGITMHPHSFTPALIHIKQKLDAFANCQFTSALLNQYRNGNDSMGWHRDNEKELGPEPIIASVSFGATRKFQFRNYLNKNDKLSLPLTHGSLLLMRGTTNHFWEHQIPKTKQPIDIRINLTFRILN